MSSSLMARVFQREGRLDRGDLWFSDAPAQRTTPRLAGLWLYNGIAAALLIWQMGVWWTSTRLGAEPVSQQSAAQVEAPATPVQPVETKLPDVEELLLDADMLALWQPVEAIPVVPFQAVPESVVAQPVQPALDTTTNTLTSPAASTTASPAPSSTASSPPPEPAEALEQRPATATPLVEVQRVEPAATITGWQRVEPDDVSLGIARAEALYRADDAATAYHILKQINELAPDNARLRELHGRLLVQDAQFIALIERLAPARSLAELEMLAFAWYQTEDYRSSVQAYRRLLADNTNPQPEWMLWLAIGLEQLSEQEQAQQWYRQFLSRRQGQPESLVAFAQDRLRMLAP